MRDVLVFALLPVLLYFAYRTPVYGLTLWIWSSLMYLNGWLYGFAGGFRYNLMFTAATWLGYLAGKKRNQFVKDGLFNTILLFYFLTCLSTFTALEGNTIAWSDWSQFTKVILFYLTINLIIRDKISLEIFLWGIALSVSFYGSVEALKYIASGGGHKIRGMIGHILGDRNDLALAMNMSIPILAYLQSQTKHPILKNAFKIMIVLIVIGVIGTNSRGGLIGLAVLYIFAVVRAKKKFFLVFVIPILIPIGLSYVPESWHERMNTIQEADEDSSFMGRVHAWKIAILIAADNPMTGGGFKASQHTNIWVDYMANFDSVSFIPSTYPMLPEKARAAHSIYFQVMGDHGFFAFFIFMLILYFAYAKCQKIRKLARKEKVDWLEKLSSGLLASIVILMAQGASVSMAYFDMVFAIFALLSVLPNNAAQLKTFNPEPEEDKAKIEGEAIKNR